MPGMENQNGHFEIKSPFQIDPGLVKAATKAVVSEDEAISKGAVRSYHCFKILMDQVMEKVPDAHPMDVALTIYARLNANAYDIGPTMDAFKLGIEVATLLSRGTQKHQASKKVQADVPDQSFAQVQQNQSAVPGSVFEKRL